MLTIFVNFQTSVYLQLLIQMDFYFDVVTASFDERFACLEFDLKLRRREVLDDFLLLDKYGFKMSARGSLPHIGPLQVNAFDLLLNLPRSFNECACCMLQRFLLLLLFNLLGALKKLLCLALVLLKP